MRNNNDFEKRIEKLQGIIKNPTECFLVNSEINRYYLCGMRSSAGELFIFKNKVCLLIDGRYIEKARETVAETLKNLSESSNAEVVLRGTNPYEQISRIISEENADTIIIETAKTTIFELENFRKKLAGNISVKIKADNVLSHELSKTRMVKTDSEAGQLLKAQKIAERAFTETLNYIKIGRTEREIARFLDFKMLEYGAEKNAFDTIVLTGKNTSLPHGVPSDTPVKNGDFTLIDFGARVEGYHSDTTRTLCVGSPNDKMREVYEIVKNAQQLGLDSIKPRVSGKDLDGAVRSYIAERGYGANFSHSLGHGVGLEIHEAPNAAPSTDTELAEGNVVTCEPGIYIEKEFGVRIEDCVIVTKTSHLNFCALKKDLILL